MPEFKIPTHPDASGTRPEASGIGISSAGVCIWPIDPLLASSFARPAAALRDRVRGGGHAVRPRRVPFGEVDAAALHRKEISRIILTRPAVEAGERLGFLPGDLAEKVDPYMRPLYDALRDMMDMEKAQQLIERGTIEVAPLAFMRGRTLNDSFVILDEAQNTTGEQMKMFLTRLGENSKAVITGDVTQIDLPAGTESGLVEATRVLQSVRGIGFIHFEPKDVVRHPLVQSIIQAYDRARGSQGPHRGRGGRGEPHDGRGEVEENE